MSEPFYEGENVRLYVLNKKILRMRLEDLSGKRDTGYINLPSTFHSDREKEKFRFYTVLNYFDDDVNEFGLWVYAYHSSFNYKIHGCTFRVVKGLNTIALPLTTVSDSVMGVFQSPCYEIVNDEGILDFLIHFPNMEFQAPAVDGTMTDVTDQSVGNDAVATDSDGSVTARKEVHLGTELLASFKEMMNETDYDVYFVVDGKKIGSFKFVLCAVSDVFRAAFKKHTKESQSGEIAIYDFGHNIVQTFVDALHKHMICFNDDPVMTLQLGMIANKYNVACIEKAARDAFNVMNVDQHNFVDAYR